MILCLWCNLINMNYVIVDIYWFIIYFILLCICIVSILVY